MAMSAAVSPEPVSRGDTPKRRRSGSAGSGSSAFEDSGDAALQYAYDEDLPSDGEQTFSPDGERERKRVRIERPRALDYVPHLTLRGHKRGVASVKFSPDGKWIASCSADCTIKIWDAKTGALSHTLEGHLAGISTIAWSPDSKVLASGSDDKLIRLWDISTGKSMPMPLVGHHNYVYSLSFSPKGNMLASGSYDEALFLWDVRTARLMRSLPAHSDPVSGVDFVRDGTLVASCSSDGLIRIWDTATGQCLKTLVHEDNAAVTSVKFAPNGKFVLAATLDSCVRLWNYVDGRVVKTYQGHNNEKFSIHVCFGTYSADVADAANEGDMEPGEPSTWAFAACGSEDGSTILWDVNSKEILQVVEGHDGVVLGADFNEHDGTLATYGVDKTIRLWRRRPVVPNPRIQSPILTNGDHKMVDGPPEVDS